MGLRLPCCSYTSAVMAGPRVAQGFNARVQRKVSTHARDNGAGSVGRHGNGTARLFFPTASALVCRLSLWNALWNLALRVHLRVHPAMLAAASAFQSPQQFVQPPYAWIGTGSLSLRVGAVCERVSALWIFQLHCVLRRSSLDLGLQAALPPRATLPSVPRRRRRRRPSSSEVVVGRALPCCGPCSDAVGSGAFLKMVSCSKAKHWNQLIVDDGASAKIVMKM